MIILLTTFNNTCKSLFESSEGYSNVAELSFSLRMGSQVVANGMQGVQHAVNAKCHQCFWTQQTPVGPMQKKKAYEVYWLSLMLDVLSILLCISMLGTPM